jgi:molybdate transport system substrate-binding protein
MRLDSGTKRLRTLAAAAAVFGVAAALAGPAMAADVLVFGAASLKNALDAVGARYTDATGRGVKTSYASSAALARQIEQGAPADIFISADLAWMDYLAGKGLIRPETRSDLLGNHIVLIAPKDSAATAAIAPGFDLAGLLGADGRLAVADTTAVPAGKYAKAALQALGIWPTVASRLAEAENVRAALALVSRGEAPLGIVYRTDAAVDPGVKIIGVFPDDTHPPIVYPAALLKASTNPDAPAFLDYLRSEAARAIFAKEGFTTLE